MNESNENLNLETIDANILIVDDEPANILVLKKMLEIKGYSNIVTTLDPTQTLPLYLEHKSDLILLDINMPGMDGSAVMEQLFNVRLFVLLYVRFHLTQIIHTSYPNHFVGTLFPLSFGKERG